MATKTETETMEYDDRGLLVKRVWTDGTTTKTETMEYDKRGLLVGRTVVSL